MASCFKVCLDCVQGPSVFNSHVRLRENVGVSLDSDHCGKRFGCRGNVILLKDGRRICGSGAAIGNAPLVQNKSYFEVKVQQTGQWGVGVALRDIDPDLLPLGRDSKSCVLRNTGDVFFDDRLVDSFEHEVEEGSVVVSIRFDNFIFKTCQWSSWSCLED
ncbi:unnamed protein product [Soboliphyme baturini]|uniref:SPRY domain-containing protein 7 n=1 Tax=Soboliphyme baturini TaxID=241478 RepID=A0A183IU68_9BILA|nr:unnamed protein product [Soboliphyme baturini]